MPKNIEILGFALAHERDPLRASRLADQMGPAMLNVTPAVSFPPHWVKAMSKGPVDTAAYVVTHCDDPETLLAVLGRDSRKAVRLAVAKNPHIDEPVRALLEKFVTEHVPGYYEIRRLLAGPGPTPAQQRRALLLNPVKFVQDNPSTDLLAILNDSATKPASARRVISRLISSEQSHLRSLFQKELARTIAGVTSSPAWQVLAEKVGLHLAEVLELYSSNAPAVLNSVFRVLYDRRTDQIPSELVDLMLAYDAASTISNSALYRASRAPRIFSDPDIARLSKLAPWHDILIHQMLTPTEIVDLVELTPEPDRFDFLSSVLDKPYQISALADGLSSSTTTRLIGLISDPAKELLLVYLGSQREISLALLSSLDADYRLNQTAKVPAYARRNRYYSDTYAPILKAIVSPEDPLLMALLAHASNEELIQYLGGGWSIHNDQPLSPRPDLIPELLDRFSDSEDQYQKGALQDIVYVIREDTVSPEALAVLVDLLPDPSRRFLTMPGPAEHIFERLSSLKLDPDIILEHLEAHPEMSLSKTVQFLTAFSRVSTLQGA